ncbi:MAG: DUF5930 domain-containing protein, partial [Geminicoccaceae bacterium]
MAKDTIKGSSGRKRQLFARRQVYLRAGQDSQYVELSPLLQIGVAFGFAVLALWLIGASYGAFNWASGNSNTAALLTKLDNKDLAIEELEDERDAALEDAARIAHLETALADARSLAADASKQEEARELIAELDDTKAQLEEVQLRLSESRADHAALQAKFEAELSATTNASEKTAEEASSLHQQLEQAFGEIEALQEERDTATAKLEAATSEKTVKDEALERNTDLLKAATSEIERLQESIARNGEETEENIKWRDETIRKLETDLGDAVAAREGLEQRLAELTSELDEARATASTAELSSNVVAQAESQTAIDAAVHARSIEADLKEADLLAMIDDLRGELAAGPSTPVEAGDNTELVVLRQRVSIAEAEIEQLILAGLKADGETAIVPISRPESSVDLGENERLRAELLATQADVIKLKAD